MSSLSSPEKPFACSVPECGHTFTNEEHLTVHSKKHDMALQLGLGQKVNAFPADQTPTPTRFIRNCEEVGLFQELQNVNPFDEGFKRAMESEGGILISLDNAIAAATSDDALHTPHIFPNLADVPDSALYTTSTRKHTVTRSSSDESTTVKHFESIETKLTNEVTIEKHDKKTAPSNMIVIQSNFEIRKGDFSATVANEASLNKVGKELNVVRKDVMLTDTSKNPVMSQQSLDFAIDSLTSNVDDIKRSGKELPSAKNIALIDTMRKNMKCALENASKNYSKSISIESDSEEKSQVKRRGKKRRSSDISDFRIQNDNYEVMLKLPNGDVVHMRSSDKSKPITDTKQKLKDAIENKLKSEIETKIRKDIENKINNEVFLKVRSPDCINTAVLSADSSIPVLVQLTTPKKPFPVALLAPVTKNVSLVPVAKIAIPPDRYANKIPDKKTKALTKTPSQIRLFPKAKEPRIVQHNKNCEILTKVGAQCSLKCAEDDSNLPTTEKPGTGLVSNSKAVKSKSILLQNSNDGNIDTIDITIETPATDVSNVNTKFSLTRQSVLNIDSAELRRESQLEAVRRYRSRQKEKSQLMSAENKRLVSDNMKLSQELVSTRQQLVALKNMFIEHCNACKMSEDLRVKYAKFLEKEALMRR